jgi:drug/metabolite transporter (DMT)-like permease
MLKGIALKISATLAFALMAALVKASSSAYPVSEIVFFRSVFSVATLAAWLSQRGEWPAALRTRRPLGHIGRSLAGSAAVFGYFLSLAFLPLANATAFTFASPLMVALMAAVVLGENVSLARAAAVAFGFVGVLVMLSGDMSGGMSGATTIGSAIALCSAGATAVAMIQIRRLTQSESTGAIVFYFSLVMAAFSVAAMLGAMVWPDSAMASGVVASQRFIAPGPVDFVCLAAIGGLGGLGQILMTHSYRYADASVIAGFDFASMIWAVALGYVLFGEIPTARILVGAAVVIAAGAAMLAAERRAGKFRSSAAHGLSPHSDAAGVR